MQLKELSNQLGMPVTDVKCLLADIGLDPEVKDIDDDLANQIIAKRVEFSQQQLTGDVVKDQLPEMPTQEPTKKRGKGKLAKQDKAELVSVAGKQQSQLAQAIAADVEISKHILNTRLQAVFSRGQNIGVVETLVEEQGRLNGALSAKQALFNADMERSQKLLDDVLNQLEDSDFFGGFQTPQESYFKTSQVGASSNLELNQILKSLEFNPLEN